MKFSKSQKIAYIALLIALEIVIKRFAGITTPIVSISLAFIPLVINAVLFGPVAAAVSSAIADFIGALLFAQGIGVYFPGFTLSAALNGLTYGLLLYRKPKKLWRISLASFITSMILSLGLGTYWIYVMSGQGFWALIPPRILQNVLMLSVKIPLIWVVVYRIIPIIGKDILPQLNQSNNMKTGE